MAAATAQVGPRIGGCVNLHPKTSHSFQFLERKPASPNSCELLASPRHWNTPDVCQHGQHCITWTGQLAGPINSHDVESRLNAGNSMYGSSYGMGGSMYGRPAYGSGMYGGGGSMLGRCYRWLSAQRGSL